MGDQFHSAGSSWYPYLPPNGFDRCTVCTCHAETLEIKCPREQCPPLQCSEKIAYRPNKTACCRRCPEVNIMNFLFTIFFLYILNEVNESFLLFICYNFDDPKKTKNFHKLFILVNRFDHHHWKRKCMILN